jgi:carbonic anhydrase
MTSIKRLQDGNARFVSGTRCVDAMQSHSRMAQLAEHGQKPFAIVLTCSDSRSPVEMIFDQGLGDVFVVRVAGNFVAPSLLASIEFAASSFGSSVVVVMGHTRCGAVNFAVEQTLNPKRPLPSPNFHELLGRIQPSVEKVLSKDKSLSKEELVEQSGRENVERNVFLIHEQSEIIQKLVAQRQIAVVGALLDIQSGRVEFLNEAISDTVQVSTEEQNNI